MILAELTQDPHAVTSAIGAAIGAGVASLVASMAAFRELRAAVLELHQVVNHNIRRGRLERPPVPLESTESSR